MSKSNSPRVTIAAIVIGYKPTQGLHVLLTKRKSTPFKGGYSLPETIMNLGENAQDAIERELEDFAELSISYISQMHTFTETNRDPRGASICITYLALVNSKTFEISLNSHNWEPLTELPPLAFDHNQIIQEATKYFSRKLTQQPIAFNLLNTEFTFADVEKIYLHGTQSVIDRRNFKKKMLSYQLLIPLNKKVKSEGRGRPAELFRLNKTIYRALMDTGFHIEV